MTITNTRSEWNCAGVHATIVEEAIRGWTAGGGTGRAGCAPVLQLPKWELLRVPGVCHRVPLAGSQDVPGAAVRGVRRLLSGGADEACSLCHQGDSAG